MDAGVIITYNVTCKVLNTKTGIPTGGSYYAAMEAGGGGWTPRFFNGQNPQEGVFDG